MGGVYPTNGSVSPVRGINIDVDTHPEPEDCFEPTATLSGLDFDSITWGFCRGGRRCGRRRGAG